MKKKLIIRIAFILMVAAMSYGFYYCWFSFPIISGFSAKNACSCAFIQSKTKAAIENEELGAFPLSLSSISINYNDSSVVSSVFGMAKKKAIFRRGTGCTIVNDFSEKEIRSQVINIPPPKITFDSSQSILHDERFKDAMQFVFNHRYKNKDVHTRAVLIMHKGKIVAEHYAKGYDSHTKFLGWSIAKSITGALIGILVKQNKLQTSAPAPVAEWINAGDAREKITLQHLLQQTSGLNFVEDYGSYSHVTNMLFNKGNMAHYAAMRSLKQAPGTHFNYSSGNSNILSRIIRTTVGEKDYHAFAYNELFYKIGMNETLLEPDASGTYVGSSYIYATARDYATFGQLYLNDGVWNNERLFPEGWVKQSTTPAAASPQKNYGYQLWLNGFDKSNPTQREYPEAPADMFLADGFGGQRIYIIPSLQLVVVRMGLNMFDEHTFLRKLLHSFAQQ